MTNYERLYGSPEKAAETILSLCENAKSCETCVLKTENGNFCGEPLTWLLMEEQDADQICQSCRIE